MGRRAKQQKIKEGGRGREGNNSAQTSEAESPLHANVSSIPQHNQISRAGPSTSSLSALQTESLLHTYVKGLVCFCALFTSGAWIDPWMPAMHIHGYTRLMVCLIHAG